jgi:hypothetical protein
VFVVIGASAAADLDISILTGGVSGTLHGACGPTRMSA